MPKEKVEPKLAATILLLRDSAAQLEVFMVERHHQIDFATGALVFPGGKAEEADSGASMRAHCDGVDHLDDEGVTVRVTAIRETFEESGVLLARPQGASELVDARRLAELESRHRAALQEDRIDLQSVVESEGLTLACDQLVPFAHWITPDMLPKRFDTHFFLAIAPGDQLALHDGSESVDSVWTTPADALSAEKEGRRTIVFATLANIQKLGRASSMAQAIESAQNSSITTVLPWVAKEDDGELMLCIPAEADYGMTKIPLAGLRG